MDLRPCLPGFVVDAPSAARLDFFDSANEGSLASGKPGLTGSAFSTRLLRRVGKSGGALAGSGMASSSAGTIDESGGVTASDHCCDCAATIAPGAGRLPAGYLRSSRRAVAERAHPSRQVRGADKIKMSRITFPGQGFGKLTDPDSQAAGAGIEVRPFKGDNDKDRTAGF